MTVNKSLVWFRRDLRAFDHAALHHALTSSNVVYCAFIFDEEILAPLPRADRRVEFIHASLVELDAELRQLGGHLIVRHAVAADEIPRLAAELGVEAVFVNGDYEPQAIARDAAVAATPAAGRPPVLQLQGPGHLREKRGADPGRTDLLGVHAVQERLAQADGGRAAVPGALAGRAACGAAGAGAARPRAAQPRRTSALRPPTCGRWGFRPGCRAPPRCSRTSSRASAPTTKRATTRP